MATGVLILQQIEGAKSNGSRGMAEFFVVPLDETTRHFL